MEVGFFTELDWALIFDQDGTRWDQGANGLAGMEGDTQGWKCENVSRQTFRVMAYTFETPAAGGTRNITIAVANQPSCR